jgi:hypothetical protein
MSKERELLQNILDQHKDDRFDIGSINHGKIRRLLAQPEQEPTPLSEEEMFHHWLYLEEVSPYLNFTAGVRYAEAQHGIGVDDE